MQDPINGQARPRAGSRWWPMLKWGVFALMLYFVGQRAIALWQSTPTKELHVNVLWLIPAALLYLIGWLPWIWFWRVLLKRLDQRPTRYEALRAYVVSQVGKYVPGKAMVLVIRGAELKNAGVNPILAALTGAYETLIAMSAGAAITMGLAPLVIPTALWERLPAGMQFLRQQPLLVPAFVAIVTIASTPFTAWLFTQIGRKAVPRATDAPPAVGITAKLVLQGVLITSVGWVCHAFSLGCTLQSISNSPLNLSHLPVWLASVASSTVAGFVVLVAPGGLGVREWVLIEILKDQPTIGTEKAIVAAGLLRLVWFVAELVAAGLFYLAKPRPRAVNPVLDVHVGRTSLPIEQSVNG